jgi:hypothetical protein
MLKTSVALYLSGSLALKLVPDSLRPELTFAFVFAGSELAFKFAFEFVAG